MDEVPGGDERCNLRTRLLGLFGFNAVYGHLPLGKNQVTPSLDIVGGATASLCAAQRAISTHERRRNSGQQAVRVRERRGSH